MKTFIPLLLTVFLLAAPPPRHCTNGQSGSNSRFPKRLCRLGETEKARYTKAIKQLKKVRNDASAKKTAKSIRAIVEDKTGQQKSPQPGCRANQSHPRSRAGALSQGPIGAQGMGAFIVQVDDGVPGNGAHGIDQAADSCLLGSGAVSLYPIELGGG